MVRLKEAASAARQHVLGLHDHVDKARHVLAKHEHQLDEQRSAVAIKSRLLEERQARVADPHHVRKHSNLTLT